MKRTLIIDEGRRPSSSPFPRSTPLRYVLLGAAAAIVVLCSNLALADDTYVSTKDGQDQSVIFKDDPLAAGGFGPKDIRINVMASPKRVTLIRPRTQFVTEMLKSVEAL